MHVVLAISRCFALDWDDQVKLYHDSASFKGKWENCEGCRDGTVQKTWLSHSVNVVDTILVRIFSWFFGPTLGQFQQRFRNVRPQQIKLAKVIAILSEERTKLQLVLIRPSHDPCINAYFDSVGVRRVQFENESKADQLEHVLDPNAELWSGHQEILDDTVDHKLKSRPTNSTSS